MFENMTYETILNRCLGRVSNAIDKREGSVIYDAIAPAAAELAIMYTELDTLMDRVFPDTETGEDLTKKARERSIVRRAATPAIRKGLFTNASGAGFELPIGFRLSGGDINYTVTERITAGQYKLQAETAGSIGNQYFGTLYPIDYAEGLATAQIADILIPGEDEESDDDLRKRYFESLESQAFGGNQADYKNKVEQIPGVGPVKVFPVWNGGGTVKVVIVSSEWGVPSAELVSQVQTQIDPLENQGEGLGLAPIGHQVTVAGAQGIAINVAFVLTLEGVTWDAVKPHVETVIQTYFDALVQTWADSNNLVVRISQIESQILNVDGVIDISGTQLNGGTANISLTATQIPVLGDVTNGAA